MADQSSVSPTTPAVPATASGTAGAWSTTSKQFGGEDIQRMVREVSEKVLALSDFEVLCKRESDPVVLDVASGNGSATFAAAKILGKSLGKVIGTDFSQGMIDLLHVKVKEEGWPNVEGHVMNAEDLKFPDSTFHFLTCQFGLMFFPHPTTALSEMARVLKPLGKCCIATWVEIEPIEEIFTAATELQPDNPPDFSGVPPFNFSDPKKLSDLLLNAGFADCQTHQFNVKMQFKDVDEFWSIFENNPVVKDTLEKLSDQSKERLGEVLVRRLKEKYGQGDAPLVFDRCSVLVAIANKP